jgi:ATP-dependent DNA ligase
VRYTAYTIHPSSLALSLAAFQALVRNSATVIWTKGSAQALSAKLSQAASLRHSDAAETPALLILFDMLVHPQGRNLIEMPLSKRSAALARFYKSARETERLKLSPYTLDLDQARRWLDDTSGALDEVAAKHIDGAYLAGGQCSRLNASELLIVW